MFFRESKKIVCAVAAMGMFALAATGCGGGSSSDTIKLGANLEMTGTNATFGQSATNGANLRLKK